MNKSENKKLRPIYLLVAIGLAIIPIVLLIGAAPAAFGKDDGVTAVSGTPLLPGPGYLDFTYADPAGDVKNPTGEKAESKLWWNDGYWWGSMYNNTTHAYHIYRLMWGTQTWVDTGVQLDDWRNSQDPKNTKADTLWDAASGKLYVASHWYTKNSGNVNPENAARLYRYSYDEANQTYTLDGGFPVDVNQDKSETLVMDKDSTGRLWTTYVSRPKSTTDFQVYVNTGDNDGATWGDPFSLGGDTAVPLAAASVMTDDISTLVSYNNQIAVVWSNQSETVSDTLNLALHPDGSAPLSNWQYYSATLPTGTIDDHLSTKSVAVVGDKLFVAFKLAGGGPDSDPGIMVAAYDGGDFSFHTYSTLANHDTRPILVVDEDTNTLYVFVSGKEGGSKICYKSLPIKNPTSSMGDFETGDCGIEFIEDDFYKDINNATSMKGNVSNLTGLVILAADDKNGQFYAHNTMGDPPPVVDMTEPARNATDAPADLRPISAIFSKEMNEATITTPGSFVVKGPGNIPIAGAVSYDPTLKKATFVPTLPLELLTTYTVELSSAIQDSSGTPLNEGINTGTLRETWQFTTLSASATPTVRFQTAEYTVNEGDGSAIIEVSVFPPPANKVTVDFSTSDGTATAPDDYAVTNQQIEFNPGDPSLVQTVSVPIVNDNLNELNETVNLSLSNAAPPGVLIDDAFATATLIIFDNDPEPDVMFTSDTYTASKSDGKVTLDVKLGAVSGRDVSVRYATGGGSATPGVDYEEQTGTVTIKEGETVTAASIEIIILDDNVSDADETFNVILSDPNGASLNTPPTSAKVTITQGSQSIFLPVIIE